MLNSFFLYFYQTMRIAPKNTYLSVLAAFVSGGLYAQDNPPPPPTPVGPGFPINENLVVLAVAGIVLAVYFFKGKNSSVK